MMVLKVVEFRAALLSTAPYDWNDEIWLECNVVGVGSRVGQVSNDILKYRGLRPTNPSAVETTRVAITLPLT